MNDKAHAQEKRAYTIWVIWGMILIIWSLYRVSVRLPEWADEFIFKPIVFLGPVFYYIRFKEKRSLASIGLSGKHLKRDVTLGIGFALLFALEAIVSNFFKKGTLSLLPEVPIVNTNVYFATLLSFATAFNEEVLIRGFFYTRLREGYRSEFKGMIASAAMYFMLLIPIIFTLTKLSGVTLLVFIFANLILSFANTMIFAETKTVTVPILIHASWNMAVLLYL